MTDADALLALAQRAPLLATLDRASVATILERGVLVVPVGSTEQHGPHLPIGTDAAHVEFVARAASGRLAADIPIAVAPTLAYGSSHHHLAHGATLSLGTQTLVQVLLDIGQSAVQSGARRLFFLNGHGGNEEIVQLVARDLALAHPLDVAAGSWWGIARDAILARGPGAHTLIPGHAGAFETSLMLALDPATVADPPKAAWERPVEPPSGVRTEMHGRWARGSGFSDDPSMASADAGWSSLAVAVDVVAASILQFHRHGSAATETKARR